MSEASRISDGFRRACLIAAVVIGCGYSAFQILHDIRVPVELVPGLAARVNGHPIDADSVNRTVEGMDARVRRSEAAARHEVLARMIDEELLVQRALDTGAAETNPEVRAALVRSAITRVNSEVAAEPIAEREVTEYFAAHREVYAVEPGFDVTPLYFEERAAQLAGGATSAQSRAAAARAAIDAGHSIEDVAKTADALPYAPPGSNVSPRTLATYFGPAMADAVDRLAVGHATQVTKLGNGFVLIYLRNKTPGTVPDLASIHDLVAADAMRDRQEYSLEALLTSLRQSAHIEFATSPNPAAPVAASR